MPQGQGSSSFADDLATVNKSFEDDLKTVQAHVDKGEDVPHPLVAKLLDWLPAAGGMVGGLIGAASGLPELGIGAIPGAVIGAGAGGAGGSALKDTINAMVGNPAPRTTGGVLGNEATQAAVQGGSELVGQGALGLAKKLAPSIMRSSLNPGVKVLKETGELETADTPRLVKSALDAGGSVTPSGVRMLASARDVATAAKDKIVANLGGKVAPGAVEAVAQGYADGLLVASDKKAAQKVVDGFVDQYVRDPATGQMRQWLDPGVADALKTQYRQGITYGKMAKSAIETRKAIARGLKDGLESLDTTKTLGAANAKTGDLINATNAAARANALWQNKPLAMRTLFAIAGKSPALNSMIANGAYQSAEKIAHIPAGTLMALGAVFANLSEPEPPQ